MLDLAEAQRRVLEAVTPGPPETAALTAAGGRILRERIDAPVDLPPFDNSAMDGYALRSPDVAAASAGEPVALVCVASVAAGASVTEPLASGTCARIFTGSPLPPGADAVVMQEDTRTDQDQPNRVWFLDRARPGENVRFRGEDVRRGAPLADSGARLTAGRLALLGACGRKTVLVGRAPRVALLATGSELREAGEALDPGQIYESNRVALAMLASQAGAAPQVRPLVPDEPAATAAALEQAFADDDLVVTTGGVSVGEHDLVKRAFTDLGGELAFWRVAIKPGKPFAFGRWRGKLLFGLPGNPVSALVTFWLLVRPALMRLQGAADCSPPTQPGILAEALTNPGDRTHFVRVVVETTGVRSAGRQASHALASLARSDGLVEVGPQTTLAMGAAVTVLTWR
jgi:molybdopterin molybdotransferase